MEFTLQEAKEIYGDGNMSEATIKKVVSEFKKDTTKGKIGTEIGVMGDDSFIIEESLSPKGTARHSGRHDLNVKEFVNWKGETIKLNKLYRGNRQEMYPWEV